MRDSECKPFYDDKTPSTGCGSECVQVYNCLHNMAPGYLSALCQPVSGVPGRRHLRSAGRGELDFPRVNLSIYGGRAFAYAGPTSWNSLPDNLKNVNLSLQSFKRHLTTFFFSSYLHTSARLTLLIKTRYINSLLLLLLLIIIISHT